MRTPFVLLALVVGCSSPDAPPAPIDADALPLLAAVDASAVADAFEAADALAADLVVTTWRGGTTSRESLAVAPGASGPRLRDPIAAALPDDPPYLNPAVRDAYRIAVVGDTAFGGLRFRLVEAVLQDTTRDLGIRRVWAAVAPGTNRVGAVEVDRTAGSAIYDETSRVRVDLAPGATGWLPRRVVTDTRTDVPLSAPTRVRAVWTVHK